MLDAAEPRGAPAIDRRSIRQATTERAALGRAPHPGAGGGDRRRRPAPRRTPISATANMPKRPNFIGAALQKGGEDANLVNTRLGAALALAGRRAEAEAAFRAVTGPRADLAGFWLAWLARRPGMIGFHFRRRFQMKISTAALAAALILGGASVVASRRFRPGAGARIRCATARRASQPAAQQCRLELRAEGQRQHPDLSREECAAIAARVYQPIAGAGLGRRAGGAARRPRPAAQSPTPNIWSASRCCTSASAPTTRQLQSQAVDAHDRFRRRPAAARCPALREPAPVRDRRPATPPRPSRRARALDRAQPQRSRRVHAPGSLSGQRQTILPARSRLYQQAIQAQQAAGQPVPEEWRAADRSPIAYRRPPARDGRPMPASWLAAVADPGLLARRARHLSRARQCRASRSSSTSTG